MPAAVRALIGPTTLVPPLALLALLLTWSSKPTAWPVVAVLALLLGAAVLSAVHHAEVVAHRVGEPLGSLLLAVAVTVIEVGLIVTLMLGGGPGAEYLARDTVFAALMVTVNGIAGLALLVNAGRSRTAEFRSTGTSSALATVLVLALLTMVVPNYTAAPGATLSTAQLGFVAAASLFLYGSFVSALTRTHRDFFLPRTNDEDPGVGDAHAVAPTNREALVSLVLLLVALVSVVGLAKVLSPSLDKAVAAAGLPASFVGIVIALVVLAPETIAAFNAARRDRVQTAMNLAYGSAMASIGLTIPVMAVIAMTTGLKLSLGLDPMQLALLAGTAITAVLTVFNGRVTRLSGTVHLVVVAAFVFLAAAP